MNNYEISARRMVQDKKKKRIISLNVFRVWANNVSKFAATKGPATWTVNYAKCTVSYRIYNQCPTQQIFFNK